MDLYVLARLVHILSACVLFGSGAAIAFFMLMAWRSGGRAGFALVARHVVLADWLFTASAVVIQPLSGIALAHLAGWPLTAPWLLASYGLYGFIGACWLPVVWFTSVVTRPTYWLSALVASSSPIVDAPGGTSKGVLVATYCGLTSLVGAGGMGTSSTATFG